MEVVRNFNNELTSLYECKPPISKAKMTEVTKAAIKGIKFYKHIVQSVEKFVQKCRPEFKVPGLYVIDSIVRQSRHQFGTEKDVFAPRFTKNITVTFQSLFKCPAEERPKIVRVLNLWQKNNVFPSEVIQPLLDMANPNAPSFQQSTPGGNDIVTVLPVKQKGMDSSPWKSWSQGNEVSDSAVPEQHVLPNSEIIQESLSTNTNKFKEDNENSHSAGDASLLSRLQQLAGHLLETKPEEGKVQENTVKFNKKLLDFDYSDEEEEEDDKQDRETPVEPNELALSMAQNLLNNPELLRQLQQMQQTIQQTETLKSELTSQEQFQQQQQQQQSQSQQPVPIDEYQQPAVEDSSVSMQSIPFPEEQPPEPVMPPYTTSMPVFTGQQPSTPIADDVDSVLSQEAFNAPVIEANTIPAPPDVDERFGTGIEGPLSLQDMDLRPKVVDQSVKDKREEEKSERSPRSQSSSQSRSRSSRRQSHRSRSRSPRRKRSRSRSASRSRSSHKRERHSRSRSRERERDRERKSRGLPPIKKNHVGVFSTTLWVGHLSKNCSEIDLKDNFGEYGPISSIEMILPRGCAFVCMEKRSDAQKALQKLRNLKLQGSNVKIAWAPGTGVKGKEYKDYWDVDLGTTYIPFDKLPPESELHFLEKGGVIDEDALPDKYKEYRKRKEKEKQAAMEAAAAMNISSRPTNIMHPGNPDVPASLMGSIVSSHSVPMMPPPVVQTQFGMPLPGIMPPQHMMMPPVPMGVPPPNPILMVPPTSQSILGAPLPVIPPLPSLPLGLPPAVPGPHFSTAVIPSSVAVSSSNMLCQPPGDATPTEEDGTSSAVPTTSMNTLQSSVPQGTPSRLPPMGTLQSLGQPPFGPPPPPPPPPFGMHPVMPQGSTNSLVYPPPMGANFSLPNRHPPPPPPPPPQMPPPPQNWRLNNSHGEGDMRYPAPVSSVADIGSSKQPVCYTSEGHPINSDGRPPLQIQAPVSQHPPNMPPTSEMVCAEGLHDMPLGMEDNKFSNYSGNSQQGHSNYGEHGPSNARGPLLSPNRPMMNANMPHQDNPDSMRGPDFHRENVPVDGPVSIHQNMSSKMMGPREPQHRPLLPSRMHDPHGEMHGPQHKEPILPTPDNFGPRGPPQMRMRGPSQNSIRGGPSPRGPMPHFGRGPRPMGPRPNLDYPRHGPIPENSGNYRQPPRRWNGPGPEEYSDFGQKGNRHNQPGFRGRREFFGGQQYGRGKPKNRFRNDWDRNMEENNSQNKRFNEQWPREERDWRRFRDEMYFGHTNDRDQEDQPPQDEEDFYSNRNRFPSRNRNFGDRKDRDNRDNHDRRGFRKYSNFDEDVSEKSDKIKQEDTPQKLETQNLKIGEKEVVKEKSGELISAHTEEVNSDKTVENKDEPMEVNTETPSESVTNG